MRAVGVIGLTAIGLNGVVGASIFVLPATVFGLTGPASPVVYVLVAILMALVVACFAEAGSRFDETGGPYVYARAAFGDLAGFMVGWFFFLSRLAGAAAIANGFAAYAGAFAPSVADGVGRKLAIAAAVGVLAALNFFGVRQGARTVKFLTVVKFAPLLLLVGAGLFAVDSSRVSLFAIPDTDPLRSAALLLVFAYGGFENASIPAEESLNPRKHLPVALLTTIAAVAVLYILIQVVAQGTVPELATSKTPLTDAARNALGSTAALIVGFGAIVSALGSLSALALVGPRILYAFARHGRLPSVFARIHARHLSPHWAIVAFALLVWIVAVSANFAQLALLSAVARLIFSASTCLAVPVLRRRQPAGERAFLLPGGALIPLLATGLALWLLLGLTAAHAIATAVALAAGLLIYFVHAQVETWARR